MNKNTKFQKLKSQCRKIWIFMLPQMLLITTMIGVIGGIVVGIALRQLKCPSDTLPGSTNCGISEETIFFLEFPGALLINLLKMIILPLIMTSLIASLCRMSAGTSGKMGGITLLIFLVTTVISVLIATVFSVIIKPGKGSESANSTNGGVEARTLETIIDIFRNICPRSLVEAAFLTAQTVVNIEPRKFINYTSNGTHNISHVVVYNTTVYGIEMKDGMNALGIITFSMAFGAILSVAGPRSSILKDLNDVIMDIIMVMVKLILWYSPIGIFFLLLAKMVEIDDLAELWKSLGKYIMVDIAASLVHMFIVLPILTFIMIRRNPFRYYYYFLQAIVTAFATASSGATLAVSFHCAETIAHVDPRICRFVLPLGATVHMDGTSIYEMSSAMFLAQLTGVHMNVGKIIVAGLMSGLAAISSAGIPQGAIINLVMVLGAIGVPSSEIRILYATDWLLDRVRTAINVLGDCLCCVVLQKLMKEDLDRAELSEKEKYDMPSIPENIPLRIAIKDKENLPPTDKLIQDT